ncbi:hypothetical protein C8J57DRAFT_1562859 [Mycena rebaudengoi]|nr:hypothetical protein C8J57DRAFT_1562859 [Mycena rebaudengoi]
MGARQMVNLIRQDHNIKVSEKFLADAFNMVERDAVQARKHKRFRRKRYCTIMNNRNTIPVKFTDAGDRRRADFLSFTQHVQYWTTYKLAFVSDYQGISLSLSCIGIASSLVAMQAANTLLTDPQILTAAEVGPVFADGNVASGFASFELDHQCNDFCRFFQLPTDYGNWTERKDASTGFAKDKPILHWGQTPGTCEARSERGTLTTASRRTGCCTTLCARTLEKGSSSSRLGPSFARGRTETSRAFAFHLSQNSCGSARPVRAPAASPPAILDVFCELQFHVFSPAVWFLPQAMLNLRSYLRDLDVRVALQRCVLPINADATNAPPHWLGHADASDEEMTLRRWEHLRVTPRQPRPHPTRPTAPANARPIGADTTYEGENVSPQMWEHPAGSAETTPTNARHTQCRHTPTQAAAEGKNWADARQRSQRRDNLARAPARPTAPTSVHPSAR